jgi:hypothetical protein
MFRLFKGHASDGSGEKFGFHGAFSFTIVYQFTFALQFMVRLRGCSAWLACFPDGLDVGGSGAAAAADDVGSG